MSPDLNHAPPLSRQLLRQLNWLTQIWATGATPSAPVQAALDHLAHFRQWSAHRWSLKHPRLQAHRLVTEGLTRHLGNQQFTALIELMDTAAQIPSNGSAEELGIALRYLSPQEQCALTANLTQQWQTQPRFLRLLKLVDQVVGRSQLPPQDDIRSHLNALFETSDAEIQAMSLFLLHQISLTEGKAQAVHLLSRRLRLDPILSQVARAIVQAPGEPVDIEDCSVLLELLARELEATDGASAAGTSTGTSAAPRPPTDEPVAETAKDSETPESNAPDPNDPTANSPAADSPAADSPAADSPTANSPEQNGAIGDARTGDKGTGDEKTGDEDTLDQNGNNDTTDGPGFPTLGNGHRS